jgi:hypothetical protein
MGWDDRRDSDTYELRLDAAAELVEGLKADVVRLPPDPRDPQLARALDALQAAREAIRAARERLREAFSSPPEAGP